MNYITTVDGTEYNIRVEPGLLTVNGEPYEIDFQNLKMAGILSLLINNRSVDAVLEELEPNIWEVLIQGELHTVNVMEERAYRLAKARGTFDTASGDAQVKSPMPGVVLKVPVAEGDEVAKGDTVIILESMKMENELKAPRDGVVLRVSAEPQSAVEKGEVLVIIGDPEDE
jgi:biotin carboxyl carrier protein